MCRVVQAGQRLQPHRAAIAYADDGLIDGVNLGAGQRFLQLRLVQRLDRRMTGAAGAMAGPEAGN